MLETLMNSELATGLVGASVVASLLVMARQVPARIVYLLRRQLTVEIMVMSDDPAFDWFSKWLAAHEYAHVARRLKLSGHFIGDQDDMEWRLAPGIGMHWFWHKGRPVFLDRSRPDQPGSSHGPLKEEIKVEMLGRSQAAIRSLIEEAKTFAQDGEHVQIYEWRGFWAKAGTKAARSLDSIILTGGQMERIVADLDWFAGARDWYVERGIPYRRGYLLEGPPGTGKTSFVLAMAGHTGRPVCVLNLGSVNGDQALFSAVSQAPARAIVLLEDVDCAGASQQRAKRPARATDAPKPTNVDDDGSGMDVSKAALLNALDGITTPDGRIFVMTTNHPEKLDEALVRPGRADLRERFDLLDDEAQRRMFARFYGVSHEGVGRPVSPAAMQAAFMQHTDCPEAARKALKEAA